MNVVKPHRNEAIDFIVRGDGEPSLVELCRRLPRDEFPIPGVLTDKALLEGSGVAGTPSSVKP